MDPVIDDCQVVCFYLFYVAIWLLVPQLKLGFAAVSHWGYVVRRSLSCLTKLRVHPSHGHSQTLIIALPVVSQFGDISLSDRQKYRM